MNKICEECINNTRLFCVNTHILSEDIIEIFKTYYLKEYNLKNSIKTMKGINELYNYTLEEKRKGQYLALSFCNYCCLQCDVCTLEHHMKEGFSICSNRKLVRCIGLLNIVPKENTNIAWILLKKE